MPLTKEPNFTGAGVWLDQQRSHLRARTRNWLGGIPKNGMGQYPLASGMEKKITCGDFVCLVDGKLESLTPMGKFIGVCGGVSGEPGRVSGVVRLGRLWERIEGLTVDTPKETPVYADPETQSLSLNPKGIRVGKLVNKEEYGSGLRGHTELESPYLGKIRTR